MKSLRSAGSLVAARAAVRYSGLPWKEGASVKTERHVAPPASYASASAGGSKSARINPFDGLAFLISAINANAPPVIRRSIAARKPRGAGAALACCSSIAAGRARFAAAISSRLYASILVRMSVIGDVDQPVEAALRLAGIERLGRQRDPIFQIVG